MATDTSAPELTRAKFKIYEHVVAEFESLLDAGIFLRAQRAERPGRDLAITVGITQPYAVRQAVTYGN